MSKNKKISIKSDAELEILRDAGKILAEIVEGLKSSLTIGITTKEIDSKAEELIAGREVKPAFKGYRGFPGCVCTSLNDEVVHGIPSERELKDGDIISVDVGIIHEDFYSDTAFTVGLGEIKSNLKRLMEVTNEALYKGIDQVKEGNHLSDVSYAIQTHVEANDLAIVRQFVGHGIGRNLHEDPEIPNFGPPNEGPILRKGMVLAIEPMVNVGTWRTLILEDGWTVVTEDRKPSAHFEHSVAVTENGAEILTTL